MPFRDEVLKEKEMEKEESKCPAHSGMCTSVGNLKDDLETAASAHEKLAEAVARKLHQGTFWTVITMIVVFLMALGGLQLKITTSLARIETRLDNKYLILQKTLEELSNLRKEFVNHETRLRTVLPYPPGDSGG